MHREEAREDVREAWDSAGIHGGGHMHVCLHREDVREAWESAGQWAKVFLHSVQELAPRLNILPFWG